jgi:integrase
MPRFRSLADWADVYDKIIDSKQVCAKTKANRRNAVAHVLRALGARTISSIRPHEVASMVNSHAAGHPQTAKRVLFEARDIFGEAMNYGWIDRNPAISVKAPVVRIQRKRLSLEQWQEIHAYAAASMPPWVARMLTLAVITGQRRSDLVKMRFADVWDGHLHIEQAKTGTRLALPLALRLDAVGMTLGEAIEDCRAYSTGTEFMLRKHDGHQLGDASLSARFETAREAVIQSTAGIPASLHECRSLSERLYRAQGIDTMILLGHKHQAMTDIYNDDRGLTKGKWKTLALVKA